MGFDRIPALPCAGGGERLTSDLRILHLTLKAKWFGEIASGEKVIEFREIKPWSTSRVMVDGEIRYYDEVWFTNGYRPEKDPWLRVEWRGVSFLGPPEFKPTYCIHLGDVLEVKRWPRER